MNPHQKPQEDVVVTQEDRRAAEATYKGLFAFFRDAGMTFTRSHTVTPDNDDLVQAFARHRLLGYEAGRRDMREAAGWQPIETAPKDGATYVDLFTNLLERVTDARWNPDRRSWEHWHLGGFDTMEWVKVDGEPTHWMPVPTEPLGGEG